jgi:hypothetical protein
MSTLDWPSWRRTAGTLIDDLLWWTVALKTARAGAS